MSKVPEARRSSARFLARMLPGAVAAPIAGFLAPCVTVRKSAPPTGKGWAVEILFEGLRLQGQAEKGRVVIRDVTGAARTEVFPRLAAALARLPVNRLVVDGIAVVQAPDGASDGAALERALAAGSDDEAVFFAFDLLHLDGFDIRGAPLGERKRVLASLLEEADDGRIAFSAHADGDVRALLSGAEAMGLAGIVCKRAHAPYIAGASGDWVAVLVRGKARRR